MIQVIELSEMKDAIVKDSACRCYICIDLPPRFLRFSNVQLCTPLAPQKKLLQDYKFGNITMDEFKSIYARSFKNNPLVLDLVRYIISESKNHEIFIICNGNIECQRLVLMEMFDNISNGVRL